MAKGGAGANPAAYLDHIGVSVSPNSRLAELLAILGLSISGTEAVEREKVAVEWIPLPNEKKTKIELLTATSPESAIAKFQAKLRKDAIHHLSFRVSDIAAVANALAQAGFRLIHEEAKPGADECLVNFVHPQSTGGILVEITQKRP